MAGLLGSAVFPRYFAYMEALNNPILRSTAPSSDLGRLGMGLLKGGFDIASLPGRAYASLARPQGETYTHALGRTQSGLLGSGLREGIDQFSEDILRDPATLVAPLVGRIGSGLLGRIGDAAAQTTYNVADAAQQGGGVNPLAIGMGLAMPNKNAARITPEERAANFKNWFGDSKVVDEAGNPTAMFRATFEGEGIAQDAPTFWSREPDYVQEYAAVTGRNSTAKAFLKIENPIIVDASPRQFSDPSFERPYIEQAIQSGNDGVIFNDRENGDQFAVPLKRQQIKSATGNRGTFDPLDPNITHFSGRNTTNSFQLPRLPKQVSDRLAGYGLLGMNRDDSEKNKK